MQRLVNILTVLLLVLTLGLHWALLQTVAWTGMVVSYSRENSLREALGMTFDGHHPCGLCKTIQQGRAEERKQNQEQPDSRLKLEFPLPNENPVFIAPVTSATLRDAKFFSASFRSKPPTPPPRSAAA